ncbi:MAG: hypothetical protein AAF135_05790 [Bacteroidota bacterium]
MKRIILALSLIFAVHYGFSLDTLKVFSIFSSTDFDKSLSANKTQEKFAKFWRQEARKGLKDAKDYYIQWEPSIVLMEKDFNEPDIKSLVERLGRKKHGIVFWHIYDHGVNQSGLLPEVYCYSSPGKSQPDIYLNVEEAILNPLKSSALRMTFLFVDACNKPSTQPPSRATLNKQAREKGTKRISENKLLKKIKPSKIDPQSILKSVSQSLKGQKELKVKKVFQYSPIGLLLSSEGAVGVSSSSLYEQALGATSFGGLASYLLYDLLKKQAKKKVINIKRANWLGFLTTFRANVEASVYQFAKKTQRPVWKGIINETLLPDHSSLYPDLDTAAHDLDSVELNNAFYNAKIFCQILNRPQFYSSWKRELADSALCQFYGSHTPADILIRDRIAGAWGWQTLEQYMKARTARRSRLGFLGNRRKKRAINSDSLLKEDIFLDSTLVYQGYYKDRNSGLEGYSFRVDKQLGGQDTVIAQAIIVGKERSSRANLWIQMVTDAVPDSIRSFPRTPPPAQRATYNPSVALDFKLYDYQRDVVKRYFRLLRKPQISIVGDSLFLEREKDLFEDIDSSRITTIRKRTQHVDTFTVREYFDHVWTDFAKNYDETEFLMCTYEPVDYVLENGDTVRVIQTGEDQWESKIRLVQGFRGYTFLRKKRGRYRYHPIDIRKIAYQDRTDKIITLVHDRIYEESVGAGMVTRGAEEQKVESPPTGEKKKPIGFRTRVRDVMVDKASIKNSADCDDYDL